MLDYKQQTLKYLFESKQSPKTKQNSKNKNKLDQHFRRKYLIESKVLQYFGNLRLNLANPEIFDEVM